jgi:nitroreductase
MDLWEALYTTRAMRKVKPDPVPDEAVQTMLDAAIRAPSGSNSQAWRFVAVTDPHLRTELGDLYREAFGMLQATFYAGAEDRARAAGDTGSLRVIGSSRWLAENFAKVPLVVLAFSRNDPTGASIYPAVWNMMLAARGLGLGTCLTTVLGVFKSPEVFDLIGVPVDRGWNLNAAVTCGYPLGRWGVAERKPVNEVAFADRWGDPVPWRLDGPRWSPPPD